MYILGQIGEGGSAADTERIEWIHSRFGRLEKKIVKMWTGWRVDNANVDRLKE
jgi:hypothetical protein